jgi:hypothetical protein
MSANALNILCILLMLASCAQAAVSADDEANAFYAEAQQYYTSQLYQNAVKDAFLARDAYAKTNNTWGLQRCDKLVDDVEAAVTKDQLVSLYYQIASDYYSPDSTDIRNLDRSVEMAGRCKTVCAGDTTCSLKCSDMADQAQARIDALTNSCIRTGDDLLEKANGKVYRSELLEARTIALNASAKYESCGYAKGIRDAAELIEAIDAKMEDVRQQAKASYDNAWDSYAAEKSAECLKYANISLALYERIGDAEGVSQSRALIGECHNVIGKIEAQLRKEADDDMKEAKRLYLVLAVPDCANATKLGERARDLYRQLYQLAVDVEGKKPPEEQHKMRLYKGKERDANTLLADKERVCGNIEGLRAAEAQYASALEAYTAFNYIDALAYANKAKEIFESKDDYVDARKCDSLIAKIKADKARKDEGDGYMRNAQAKYDEAGFQEAANEAAKARAVYAQMRHNDGVTRADELGRKILEAGTKLQEADTLYGNGRSLYDSGEYDKALESLQKADKLYKEVKFKANTDKIAEMSADCTKQLEAKRWKNTILAAFFIVLILLSAFLLVQYRRQKSEMDERIRRSVADGEETLRRRAEELTLRSEGDTKAKVDEELRKLIDSERNKLEDD